MMIELIGKIEAAKRAEEISNAVVHAERHADMPSRGNGEVQQALYRAYHALGIALENHEACVFLDGKPVRILYGAEIGWLVSRKIARVTYTEGRLSMVYYDGMLEEFERVPDQDAWKRVKSVKPTSYPRAKNWR